MSASSSLSSTQLVINRVAQSASYAIEVDMADAHGVGGSTNQYRGHLMYFRNADRYTRTGQPANTTYEVEWRWTTERSTSNNLTTVQMLIEGKDMPGQNNSMGSYYMFRELRPLVNTLQASGEYNYTNSHATKYIHNHSFTGSHLCVMPLSTSDTGNEGMIVEFDNPTRYVNLNLDINPRISESLPRVVICKNKKSKRVFGVLYEKILPGVENELNPHVQFGASRNSKLVNDHRFAINSIGEGAVWVCDEDGTFESGDLICSSSIPGYGCKQDDDLIRNYTVAKISCDCVFSLTKIKKQIVKASADASGNISIHYNEDNTDYEYHDFTDKETNEVIYKYPFKTRFLFKTGIELEGGEEEYHSRKANGEEVFIACFVGCVYYCG